MATTTAQGVLLIYTGGTLGSLHEDPRDPLSPLVPAPLERVIEMLPLYDSVDRKLPLGGTTVRIGTHSWETPLDSSNITSSDWREMASVIRKNYNDYEGFVVLHGTDTLAYTASALAFLLDNLDKPVIVTGSQRPIGELRSDAVQNLVTSIEIAAAASLGTPVVPEVCVFFRDKLYRGCRTTKMSASSYSGFDSPNFLPLAEAGEHIVVNEQIVAKSNQPSVLSVAEKIETNIASMDIFPGMDPDLLRSMLNAPNLRGIVLKTFGTGNAPSTPEFLDAIEEAVKAGRVIVDITQCRAGEVELGLYEVSAGLLSRGVISGMDMTPEAALAKLAVVLGSEPDMAAAADRMQLNLRGEQRQSVFNLHFESGSVAEDQTTTIATLADMTEGLARYDPNSVERVILRITGLRIPEERRGRIEFKAYIDMPDASVSTADSEPNFLGEASKKWREEEGSTSVFLDVTEPARAFVDNRRKNTITLVSIGGSPFAWERADLAFYANC